MDGPTLYARLNERRRRERDGLGWLPYSWSRVARESGVPHNTILSYKHGRSPQAETLAKLETWLNRTVKS